MGSKVEHSIFRGWQNRSDRPDPTCVGMGQTWPWWNGADHCPIHRWGTSSDPPRPAKIYHIMYIVLYVYIMFYFLFIVILIAFKIMGQNGPDQVCPAPHGSGHGPVLMAHGGLPGREGSSLHDVPGLTWSIAIPKHICVREREVRWEFGTVVELFTRLTSHIHIQFESVSNSTVTITQDLAHTCHNC